LSSEIRTTRPRYGDRIRIPQERTGGESGRIERLPLALGVLCCPAVVDQHLLERVPGHLPRVGLPAIRWPSSAPRVRCSVLKRASSVRCSPCVSLRADRYRQRAAEPKDRATQAKDPSIKSAFENVVAGWVALSEQVERIDREKSSVCDQENNRSVR
jgi:hypothetical protein